MELLTKVKTALNITGNYQNDTILEYINETKNYIIGAGVSTAVINSDISAGVITRGVSDLWNYGMGSADFSPYFIQRVIQLRNIDTSLNATSETGSKTGYTKITVDDPQLIYRYKLTDIEPSYNEDLSDWIEWDGVSEIEAVNGSKICISQVTSEYKMEKSTVITVRSVV